MSRDDTPTVVMIPLREHIAFVLLVKESQRLRREYAKRHAKLEKEKQLHVDKYKLELQRKWDEIEQAEKRIASAATEALNREQLLLPFGHEEGGGS